VWSASTTDSPVATWVWSLRRSSSFKVTDYANFGTNRKLICDFLLVINTNLHVPPILHRFQVTADYWSNFRQWQGVTSL